MSLHQVIATVGGQPQIVTLALDRLLVLHPTISEIAIHHLSPGHTLRYAAALDVLRNAVAQQRYGAHGLRCSFTPIMHDGELLDDITDSDRADAVYSHFHRTFRAAKAAGATIHLLPTGGRRTVGMLALAAAQVCFAREDRVWHLFSSDDVRQASSGGAQLHLPDNPAIKLLRIPVTPISEIVPQIGALPVERPRDPAQHTRCATLWQQLTERQREVLRTLCESDAPSVQQSIAAALHITPSTVESHMRAIYDLCRTIWELSPDVRLNVTWVRRQFQYIDLPPV